jgi:hypothetical protein
LVNDFAPQAKAIKEGDLPYRDQGIEYPPLSVPVLIAPAYVDDSTQGFIDGFMWEMLAFDLAIIVLIALALPGETGRVLSALGVYTVGLVTLSGVVLDRSLIDYGPLALDRFDLVPALFVLAAVLARGRGRSATWSGLLSVAVAIKAFPLFLYPALLRGERNLQRVLVAGALPLVLCAAVVIVTGDEFGSAITYHTERTLQVESLGAGVFEVAHMLGASGIATGVGHGGFEISASGATAAGSRWCSGRRVTCGSSGPAGARGRPPSSWSAPCSRSWSRLPPCSLPSSCSGCCPSPPAPTGSARRTWFCSWRSSSPRSSCSTMTGSTRWPAASSGRWR